MDTRRGSRFSRLHAPYGRFNFNIRDRFLQTSDRIFSQGGNIKHLIEIIVDLKDSLVVCRPYSLVIVDLKDSWLAVLSRSW